MTFKKSEQGFTLIEVIIAFGVLAIGILSMFALLTQGIRGNATANRITTELVHGSDQIEEILNGNYSDIVDVTADGSAGLDDNDNATADYISQSTDGKFSMFLNVATDYPDDGMKTIKIIVRANSGQSPDTVLTSLKVNL